MKRKLLILLLLFSHSHLYAMVSLQAQPTQSLSTQKEISGQFHRSSASADEAGVIIRSILDVVGLKPNFEIRAADISNAAAVVYNGKRFILYDKAFIRAINTASSTHWAGISILAHEIGHHLNGHTLNRSGSNPADELEADEFSGFVLRKLGASLADAQAAMSTISEEHETATHPERSRRLRAIAQGWNKAGATNLALKQSVEEANQEALHKQQQPDPKQVLASQRILGEVIFERAPANKFYITSNRKLVGLKNNQLVLYGELEETNDRDFPYVLTDHKRSIIYVSQEGYLYNTDGSQVGILKAYQG